MKVTTPTQSLFLARIFTVASHFIHEICCPLFQSRCQNNGHGINSKMIQRPSSLTSSTSSSSSSCCCCCPSSSSPAAVGVPNLQNLWGQETVRLHLNRQAASPQRSQQPFSAATNNRHNNRTATINFRLFELIETRAEIGYWSPSRFESTDCPNLQTTSIGTNEK